MAALMLLLTAALASAALPPCHPPWGNELALESPCFVSVYAQGDVSVRRYAPRGAGFAQAFVEASFPGDAGDPVTYPARLNTAVANQLLFFGGNNSAGVTIARTSPILGRPNATRQGGRGVFVDWMVPTVAYPRVAKAPSPTASLNLRLLASTLGVKYLVAALHFTVTGVPQPGDFDQACDTLLPLLPAMGYKAVSSGLWSPTYAYYTSRDFDGQHDGECLIEVVASSASSRP